MTRKGLLGATLAVVLTLAGTAVAARRSSVRSTLDRRSVLPERVHWVARTNLTSTHIRKVDFLIDGKLRWTESNPPYEYGGDGSWLVTTWLKPGEHTFTTRLTEANGSRLSERVRARTQPPPAVPAGLSGRWTRVFKGSSSTPPGKWTATINATGWRIADPLGGSNYIDVVYPRAGILRARGGIWTRNPTAAEEANNGAHVQEGNGWCSDTNATDTYRYSLNGDALTLTLIGSEHCGKAGDGEAAVWAGTWTR